MTLKRNIVTAGGGPASQRGNSVSAL